MNSSSYTQAILEQFSISSHAYVPRIVAILEENGFRPGKVYEIEVAHDDWCEALNGGTRCTCVPDVVVRLDGKSFTVLGT